MKTTTRKEFWVTNSAGTRGRSVFAHTKRSAKTIYKNLYAAHGRASTLKAREMK